MKAGWMGVALLIGVLYFVSGTALSALESRATPDSIRVLRLAAWLVSAVLFAAHIGHERFRLHSSPKATALHAAAAAAFGAFAFAAAATVRALVSGAYDSRYLLALVAWPSAIALPAFLVAWAAAAILARARRPAGA